MLALVAIGFALSATAAEPATSRLALDIDSKPLGLVLDDIHARTGFSITLTDDGWRAVPVSVHTPEAPIKDTLRALFAGFNYVIVEQDDSGMTVAVSSAAVAWPEAVSTEAGSDDEAETVSGDPDSPMVAAPIGSSDQDGMVPPAHLLDLLTDEAQTQRAVNYDDVLNELHELERQNAFAQP